jgi:beta-lactam-binding protein with PASTA domain
LSVKRVVLFIVRNVVLAVAVLAVAGLSALVTMRSVLTSQQVEVPSMLGKRVPEAGDLASARGLLLRIEGRRNDPRIPHDHIVAQEPEPGAALKSHRSVRVWLSLGPRRITLPAIEGQSLRTGRLAIDQAEVTITRVAEVDDPAPEGTVLVQRPPAGEVDVIQDGVSVLVSRGAGRGDYLMPDLIGQRASDVLGALQGAGLKVTDVRYRPYPGAGGGIVLRQTPAAGHRVSPHSSVALEVSKGDS